MDYPRVLVISNNSFSETSANGRTLGNLFIGWPKDKLAQFFISSDGLNFNLCDNYYCITDKDILYAFLHLKRAKRKLIENEECSNVIGVQGKGRKTSFRMMARNLIWGKKRWKSHDFMNWVQLFSPDIIVLFFSDSSFILNIATTLSLELNIPLISFNTEGFYFFKSNYYRTKSIFDWFWYPLVARQYKQQVRITMKRVCHSIYLNQWLQKDYDKEFGGDSSVIYTSSTIEREEHVFNKEHPVFSYVGNLNANRPSALIEVADVLQSINPLFVLDVYGKILDKESELLLARHPGISFKGFVKYGDVQTVLKNSDILFHVETRDKRWEESLKYGFSTKIADSISSGACFVLYGPPNIACSQYIQNTQSGWFADNKYELEKCIKEALYNKKKRDLILSNAKNIAIENHNQKNNSLKFQKILYETAIIRKP